MGIYTLMILQRWLVVSPKVVEIPSWRRPLPLSCVEWTITVPRPSPEYVSAGRCITQKLDEDRSDGTSEPDSFDLTSLSPVTNTHSIGKPQEKIASRGFSCTGVVSASDCAGKDRWASREDFQVTSGSSARVPVDGDNGCVMNGD